MGSPANTHTRRPAFALGLFIGLLICVPSALGVLLLNDNEALGNALTVAVGATLVLGVALLFVDRWRRFGAGLVVAVLGTVLATFLFLLWLVAAVGS